MYISTVKLPLITAFFNMNRADDSGGILYGRKNSSITISDSRIYHSSAQFSGGVVFLWQDSNVSIQYTNFLILGVLCVPILDLLWLSVTAFSMKVGQLLRVGL